MRIKWNPQRRDDQYTLEKQGDTLLINGESFDFSQLSPGDLLPGEAIDSEWFVGDVERDLEGSLQVTLILPHGPNAPESTRFPEDLVDVSDGLVELPEYNL